jgi:hypothetical protein
MVIPAEFSLLIENERKKYEKVICNPGTLYTGKSTPGYLFTSSELFSGFIKPN